MVGLLFVVLLFSLLWLKLFLFLFFLGMARFGLGFLFLEGGGQVLVGLLFVVLCFVVFSFLFSWDGNVWLSFRVCLEGMGSFDPFGSAAILFEARWLFWRFENPAVNHPFLRVPDKVMSLRAALISLPLFLNWLFESLPSTDAYVTFCEHVESDSEPKVTAFQRSTQWTWVLCLLEQMEAW